MNASRNGKIQGSTAAVSRIFSPVGILSQNFRDEYHEGSLILKPWHFPVRCPDCEYVYASVDEIRHGVLDMDLDIPAGFLSGVIVDRCPSCLDQFELNHEEPRPITQREIDGCGYVLDDVPGSDKLCLFGLLIDVFHWIFSFGNPDDQTKFAILCFIVISSPFWWNEIVEWIDVLFFY